VHRLGRRDQIRVRRRGQHLGRYLLLAQATVVSGDGLLDLFGQVVPQVPPVGDLDRLRRPRTGALGVRASTIPTHHLRAGVFA
jgi:hypothetical protein